MTDKMVVVSCMGSGSISLGLVALLDEREPQVLLIQMRPLVILMMQKSSACFAPMVLVVIPL